MCDSHNQDPDKHQCIEHPQGSIEAVDETLNVAYHHPQWGNGTLNEEVQYIITLPNCTFHYNIWICMYKASLIPELSKECEWKQRYHLKCLILTYMKKCCRHGCLVGSVDPTKHVWKLPTSSSYIENPGIREGMQTIIRKPTMLAVSYLVPPKMLPFAAPSVVSATRSGMTIRPAFPSTTCPNG